MNNYNKMFDENKNTQTREVFSEQGMIVVEETPTKELTKAKVNACIFLNLREEPSIESLVVLVLKEGSEVVVEDIDGQWSKVYTMDGTNGYVMSQFLTEE